MLIPPTIWVSLLVLPPHLTRWQATIPRWYNDQLDAGKGATPQDIQRQYPQYDQLVEELKTVNLQIVDYAKVLRKIPEE